MSKTYNISYHESAEQAPSKKHATDVGYDVVATGIEQSPDGKTVIYSTNLKVSIPSDIWLSLFPRSSAAKTGWVLGNSVGVIDPAYRGEIKVVYRATTDDTTPPFAVGERVAQLIAMPRIDLSFIAVEILDDTDRGEGGFGSTGK